MYIPYIWPKHNYTRREYSIKGQTLAITWEPHGFQPVDRQLRLQNTFEYLCKWIIEHCTALVRVRLWVTRMKGKTSLNTVTVTISKDHKYIAISLMRFIHDKDNVRVIWLSHGMCTIFLIFVWEIMWERSHWCESNLQYKIILNMKMYFFIISPTKQLIFEPIVGRKPQAISIRQPKYPHNLCVTLGSKALQTYSYTA